VFGLAAIVGFTDIDLFVLSLTQSVGAVTSLKVGAAGIPAASASNNVIEGLFAFDASADRRTGL
jgi:hypothetical protein